MLRTAVEPLFGGRMMLLVRLLMLVVVCAVVAPLARAGAIVDLLVPAYANPCCGDGPAMWNSLIALAGDPARNFGLHVIFNPASGPGVARDPNFLDAAGSGPLADLHAAGGKVYGYVATGYGSRPAGDVRAEVDAYLSGFYAGFVDGIFFDEMSNDLADTDYYRSLGAYVKSQQPGAWTFGNPGTTFVNNPSGQTLFDVNDYFDAFDTLVVFEDPGADYRNNYVPFGYLSGRAPEKLAGIVYSQPAWDPSFIGLAVDRGFGFLYVTDDVPPNPYDRLPSYWTSLVGGLQQRSAQSVPEPSPLMLLPGLVLLGGVRRARRRRAARAAFGVAGSLGCRCGWADARRAV